MPVRDQDKLDLCDLRPGRDDQVRDLKGRTDFVQGVAKFFAPGLFQETDQRVEDGWDVGLGKGPNFVRIHEIADDQAENAFAIARVTRITVDPDLLSAVGIFEVSAIRNFQFARLSEPFSHPVEERLDHQDAAGVCLTPDVGHQILVVFLKLAHRFPQQKEAGAPSPTVCGTGRRRTGQERR